MLLMNTYSSKFGNCLYTMANANKENKNINTTIIKACPVGISLILDVDVFCTTFTSEK